MKGLKLPLFGPSHRPRHGTDRSPSDGQDRPRKQHRHLAPDAIGKQTGKDHHEFRELGGQGRHDPPFGERKDQLTRPVGFAFDGLKWIKSRSGALQVYFDSSLQDVASTDGKPAGHAKRGEE